MNLPEFSEFLQSIDIDEMGRRINEEIPMQILHFQSNDIKAIENAAKLLYQKAVDSSVGISLLYLQAYHEWLQKQIGQ